MRIRLLALALLVAACGTRGERWERDLEPIGPVAAGDSLAWLVPVTNRLVVIDAPARKARTFPSGEAPRSLAAIDGGVVVLGGPGNAPRLGRYGLPSGDRTVIPLPAAYDRIAVAPGGTRAVLTFDPAAAPAPGSPAARNFNEIAVVDLAAGTATAVSLATESLAPREVVFSPAGDLAAVVLDAAVALVDLANPTLRVRIPLKLATGTELSPEEAIFAPDGAFLYVRTAEADDVLAIEIQGRPTELGGSINFLFVAGGGDLTDIAVPTGPGFERAVAALYRSGTGGLAALLDATGDESNQHVATLTRPTAGIGDLGDGRLLLHAAPSAARTTAARAVAVWEPLADRLAEDLLPGPLAAAPRFGANAGYFVHDAVDLAGRSATPALTVVTAEAGARLEVRLTSVGLASDAGPSAVLPETGVFLVGVDVEREGSGAAPSGDEADYNDCTGSVVTVGPAGGAGALPIGGVVLDERIVDLGLAGEFVWARHHAATGDVTVLPVADLRRSAARRYEGLFLAGALEGKE